MYMYVGHTWAQCLWRPWKVLTPWIWSYRWFWVSWHGCWKSYFTPLQKAVHALKLWVLSRTPQVFFLQPFYCSTLILQNERFLSYRNDSVRCLSHKQEDLLQIPRIHIMKLHTAACLWFQLQGGTEIGDPWRSLTANQRSQMHELQVQWENPPQIKPRQRVNKEDA